MLVGTTGAPEYRRDGRVVNLTRCFQDQNRTQICTTNQSVAPLQFAAYGLFLSYLLAAAATTRGQNAHRRKSEEKRLRRQEYIVRIILAVRCSVI